MNKIITTSFLSALFIITISCESQKGKTLSEAFSDDYTVGAALNVQLLQGINKKTDSIVRKHYNSIVAENCMKSMFIQPVEGEFAWVDADRFVDYGEKNNMEIVGHTLVWHAMAPDWFFVDSVGNDVSRDVLIQRMKTHIEAVVGRYKGRIHGWDVVNEAIDGPDGVRQSKWQTIIGDDYIEMAFKMAHEADPDAELYYNDYSMYEPKRREAGLRIVKNLLAKGIRIDGVGFQAHYGLDVPLVEVEKSIVAFGELGLKVMITELDLSALPFPSEEVTAEVSTDVAYQEKFNPYKEGLPTDIKNRWSQTYIDLFKLFTKHSKYISRVTFWGVNDTESWKNDWPIKGRTDYPLLFDRAYKEKSVVQSLVQLSYKN
ncbi:endo-1,4-beta-xylanase [Carboxylicivirga marina]|nr:endo-1,4-beta-xylanase [Carboxylicivirga marina]